jgi:Rrf2 family protein
MLSSRAKYAVRAALHLADRAGEPTWTPTVEIATSQGIPRKFLEAILVEMRTNGLLESRRGPGGGHRLRLRAEQIAIADIIRIVDGPLALTPCASRTQFSACADCPSLETCRMRALMQRARDAVAEVLEDCSLADLIAPPAGTPMHREGLRQAVLG